MSELLDILGYIGSTFDKPGRAARAGLSFLTGGDRPASELLAALPFSDTMGLTDPANAVYGRDLLEQWGALAPNQEGFDMGDVAGFGADIALDPLNWFGGAIVRSLHKAGKTAASSNALRESLLTSGAMPEEIARLTKAVDTAGNPIKTFHGTSAPYFESYDLSKADPDALFGRAVYTTANPEMASTYTEKGLMNAPLIPKDTPEIVRLMRTAEHDPAFAHAYMPVSRPHIAHPEDISNEISEYLQQATDSELVQGARSLIEVDPAAVKPLTQNLLPVFEEDLTGFGPHVRMQYMDVRNPFNMDLPLARQELEKIASKTNTYDMLHELDRTKSPQMAGERLWEILAGSGGEGVDKNLGQYLLKKAGYDSIQHTGGLRTGMGGPTHDVFVAFDPSSQIYNPWLAPAEKPMPKGMNTLLASILGHNVMARGFPANAD